MKETFQEKFVFQENVYLPQRNKRSVNSDLENMPNGLKENGRGRANFKPPPTPKSYKRKKEKH